MRCFLLTLLSCVLSVACWGANFVTGVTTAQIRSDFSGFVGYQFTVGTAPVAVTALGRYCMLGNGQVHAVSIIDANGTVVAYANVDMSGCAAGTFTYAAASATLPAGAVFYLFSSETAGGDTWANGDTAINTVDGIATITSSAYAYAVNSPYLSTTGSDGFGPLSFSYQPSAVTQGPSSGTWVDAEVPAGSIDGINTSFHLAHTPNPLKSLILSNALILAEDIDFTISGNVITFALNAVPQPGAIIRATYRY